MLPSLVPVLLASTALTLASATPQWSFDLKQEASGIVALESIVVSDTLVLFFNRASDDPLQINNHSAWGALWDLETSTVRPIDVLTNSFCASGALLSNGSMISIGGDLPRQSDVALSGLTAIRIFEPCASPNGDNCTLFENPQTHHLAKPRWYPTAIRIFDGSLLIAGGTHVNAAFYNIDPENSFEFFPPRDGGAVRPSAFLERSLPSNLFPRAFALPDGRVFMVANNQSIIYDIEKNTETILPDIPNNVRVTNPIDGSAILLPLSPPDYIPEVLVCGGTDVDPAIQPANLSSQFPASPQCSRIVLTEEGIKEGWVLEKMLQGGRTMPEMVHLPNGQVLIINGGRTGFAAILQVPDAIGNSNADHPALTPEIYTPTAQLGSRFSDDGLPTSIVPRMYHSSVTLTPQGNFLVAGSNPNTHTTLNVTFPSEFRVETLDPPYMFVDRPVIGSLPPKIAFGAETTVDVNIPSNLSGGKLQLALMDLGFSTHAFHSSARLIFLDATLSTDSKTLTFTMPPNGRVYPPGPAWVFLTVNDVSSEGVKIIAGSGNPPPTLE